MAEEQKPVEVAKEETPATTTEAAPATTEALKEETAAPTETEAPKEPATETPAVETSAATPAAEEEAAKEVKPVEDGQLDHKGSNFPKNFIYSKKFFWFGSEPIEVKKVPALLKDHNLAAWASETGKGLLFFNEKGQDKSTPTSAIALHEAAEPTTDGPNKFILSSKGHKHTFKATSEAERDNWVAQIKLKIAEAKELAKTIPESETYKATLASFTPAKKEEKKEDKAEETPKAAEETPAAEGAAAATAATAESPKEEAKEETKDTKTDEGKRSASRKRASIFGALLGGGKKEAPKEEKAEDKKEVKEGEAAAETPAETPAVTEAPEEEAKEEAKEGEAAAATEPAAESSDKAKAAEKPTPSKRTSIFGSLSFGKKKAEEAPATPAKDNDIPEVAETAPVIPKPEATEPLSAEVSSPAAVPAETTETAPVVNGEKKEPVKADKRKSSFPFAFGKKADSNPSSPDEPAEEKAKGPNAFSKLRATIKGKGKAVEKPAEKTEDKPAEEVATEAEEAKAEEAKAAEDVPTAEETTEAKETPVASTPTVTATA